MAQASSLADRATVEASPAAVTQAGTLVETLPADPGLVLLDRATGEELPIPRELSLLMREILRDVSEGRDIRIVTAPKELTTSAAARAIGVSRPTLMKMIAAGELPAHKVGSHTRLKPEDVTAFLQARQEQQREAMRQLLAFSDEFDEVDVPLGEH